MHQMNHFLILHDIRSAENVGAIFRTADAVGISKIYLTGYTPSPIDRFGRKRSDVAKSALGAEMRIPFEQVSDIDSLFTRLGAEGVSLVAIEQSPRAIDYTTVSITSPTAFIVGNEVTGLPDSILEKVQTIAEIPMYGEKESLNVSVATGVALYRMLER